MAITHDEAQELHEAIGAAVETGDVSGLRRAREIAAIIVSDTCEQDLTILGKCAHGVDLDREFCPHGCRV
jgi:hypothetical protein